MRIFLGKNLRSKRDLPTRKEDHLLIPKGGEGSRRLIEFLIYTKMARNDFFQSEILKTGMEPRINTDCHLKRMRSTGQAFK